MISSIVYSFLEGRLDVIKMLVTEETWIYHDLPIKCQPHDSQPEPWDWRTMLKCDQCLPSKANWTGGAFSQ